MPSTRAMSRALTIEGGDIDPAHITLGDGRLTIDAAALPAGPFVFSAEVEIAAGVVFLLVAVLLLVEVVLAG